MRRPSGARTASPRSNVTEPRQGTEAKVGPSLPPAACKVYTPQALAEAMVQAIDPRIDDTWLDPCIGPGAFVSALRGNSIPKNRILAVDIEAGEGSFDTAATTLRGVDFFRWCASTTRQFTKIVANPPYVALCKLAPALQEAVLRFSEEVDPSFGLRSNYWCAFLAASLRPLKFGGSIAFVLPAAWDYALYARPLRAKILRSFSTVEVHRSKEPLFPDVREGSVVLIAKGFGRSPESATRYDHASAAALINALQRPRPEPNGSSISPSEPPDPAATTLNELFTVTIGCVTGDVNYFLLTEEKRLSLGLPASAVLPVLSRARHLIAAQLGKEQWTSLKNANERVWLFSPAADSLRSKSVQSYLDLGARTCKLDGYKLSSRDPWYAVPSVPLGVGFMSGMTSSGPWLSLRSMRGLTATNTLYVVGSKRPMSVDELAAWGLSLLSSYTRRQVDARVRRYPDGLTKLEPHDIASLRLLPPKRVPGSIEIYRRAVRLLLTGDTVTATAMADGCVGEQRPGGHE